MPFYMQRIRDWYDKNFTIKGLLSFVVMLYCAIPDWQSRTDFWSKQLHSILALLQTTYGRLAVMVLAGVVIWLDHRTVLKKQQGKGNRPTAEAKGSDREPLSSTPPTTTVPATTPPPKSGERRIVDVTPEYLVGLFKGGQTSIQAAKLAEAFIGKWIKISGPVGDVLGSTATLRQLTFADRSIYGSGQVFMMFRAREWFDRLSTLRPRDKVTVVGQLARVNSIEIELDNCEIVD